jgi:hypothetical protein
VTDEHLRAELATLRDRNEGRKAIANAIRFVVWFPIAVVALLLAVAFIAGAVSGALHHSDNPRPPHTGQ